MNRESLPVHLLRLIIATGLFGFMMMLYWSSNLQEVQLNRITRQLEEMNQDLQEVQTQHQVIRHDLLQTIVSEQKQLRILMQQMMRKEGAISDLEQFSFSDADVEKKEVTEQKSLADPSLPNLYTKDPFYSETLAKLLPSGFIPRGIRHEATYGKPENLHPFSGWGDVSSWQGMCNVTAGGSHFGIFESYAPEMAYKLEERKDPETGAPVYWLHLRQGVYWHPLNPRHFPEDVKLADHFRKRHKVTAHDFKFWFDALMNPFNQQPAALSLRNYLGDVEELKVVDDYTLSVRWKTQPVVLEDGTTEKKQKYIAKGWTGALRPLARWVYQYFPDGTKIVEDDSDPETYRKNSVWAQNFAEHWAKNVIVSNGPWLFDGFTDRQIRFRRNPDHYAAHDVLVGGMVQELKDSPDTIWQDFRAGRLDTYSLSPEQLVELEDFLQSDQYALQAAVGNGIKRIDYLGRSYAYIGWNQARPLFASKEVRRALTMAIDRDRIIQQILNEMGEQISGPFFKNSPSYNKEIEPLPFDPAEAKRILEKEGWYDSDGDGLVDKEIDGKRVPFRFSITYFVKNPTTKAVVEYIVTAMKEIGIEARLNGVDRADLSAAFEEKNFDALTMFWGLGSPPEEPRQLWHSDGAKKKGSSNFVGFSNAEADQIIDALQYEYDLEKRKQLYHRFHEIIHEEQPYTFLYSPRAILLHRENVKNTFIPSQRQDLIPGADVASPQPSIFWLQPRG